MATLLSNFESKGLMQVSDYLLTIREASDDSIAQVPVPRLMPSQSSADRVVIFRSTMSYECRIVASPIVSRSESRSKQILAQ